MADIRVTDATEAFVQLVLAAACRAFAQDNEFLSFPLNQYTFPEDNLKFGAGGNDSPPAMQTANEFAHITNSIPRGVKFELDGDYLWNVYGDVLTRARLAAGTLTAQQKEEYADAMERLYVQTADGLRELSPKHRAYKQYRDASIQAQNDLALARLEAEQSIDPASLKQWKEVNEPALRARIADCEADWSGLGFRSEIEAAKRIEEVSARSSPSSQWTVWRGKYNPDIDMATSLQVVEYAPTGFAPYDVFDYDNWTKVQLTRAEMIAVAQQAPYDIRVRYSAAAPPPDIERVSFELRSVLVQRPWFESKVLSSRFWRLDEDEPPVSDGTMPSNARCPAYINALIFGRNLAVTSRVPVAPSIPPPALGRPSTAIVQQRFMVAQENQPAFAPKTAFAPNTAVAAPPGTKFYPGQVAVAQHGFQAAPQQKVMRTMTATEVPLQPAQAAAKQQATAMAMRRLSNESFSQAAAAQFAKAPPPLAPAPPMGFQAAPAQVRVQRPQQRMVVTGPMTAPPSRVVYTPNLPPGKPAPPQSVRPVPPPPTPPPPQPTVTRGLPENSVSIVAFICRPVPPSPNPDPDYEWS